MASPERVDPSVILQKHLPTLIQDLDPSPLLDHLFSRKIFNRCEYDQCRGKNSTTQSREIILRLMEKGTRGYEEFCSWLERYQPHLKSMLDGSARDEGAESLVFVNEIVLNEAIAAKNAVIESLENDLKEKNKLIQQLKTSRVEELEEVVSRDEDNRRQLERELVDLSGRLDTETGRLSHSQDEKDTLENEIKKLREEKSKLAEDLTEQRELYEALTHLTDNDKDSVVEEDDCSHEELPSCILGTSACDRKFLLLLPCLHALCRPCIEEKNEEVISCLCGEKVNVKDVKQADHVRRYEARNSTDIILCGFFCKQTTQAERRCLNCDVTMCKSCLASHNEIRAFEGHRIDIITAEEQVTGQDERMEESILSLMVMVHTERMENIQKRVLQTKARLQHVDETERRTLGSVKSVQRDLLLMTLRHFKQISRKVQRNSDLDRRTLKENIVKLTQTFSRLQHTLEYAHRAVMRTDAEFRQLTAMIQSKFSQDLKIRLPVEEILTKETIIDLLEEDMAYVEEIITCIGTGKLFEKYQLKTKMKDGEDIDKKIICLAPQTIQTAYATIAELGEASTALVRLIMTLDHEHATFNTLLCPRAEFNREKANSQAVTVLQDGRLQNRPNLRRNTTMLRQYEGTAIITARLPKGNITYQEIHATVELASKLPIGFQILEIAFSKDEEHDSGRVLGGRDGSVSLQVVHCMVHRGICRIVRDGKDIVRCADNTFANIATAMAELKYGVLVDDARGRLAFLDVAKNEVIAVVDDVCFEDEFGWMCGVYSPEYTGVTVELVSGENLQMTQEKLMLIAKFMSERSSGT